MNNIYSENEGKIIISFIMRKTQEYQQDLKELLSVYDDQDIDQSIL